MRLRGRLIIALMCATLGPFVCGADVIEVEPGEGGIARAAAAAKAGDTIQLKAGQYSETSVDLPRGVTLAGAGCGETIIAGSDFAILNARAGEIVIRDLELRGGGETRRGVNADAPARVERCRFVELPEAFAIMAAPLSDVVFCEFIDCDIGVRAIGEASPTVWGSLFRGGRIGVFAIDGGPFIRNNVFDAQETALMLVSRNPHPMMVLNNIIMNASKAGIEARGDWIGPIARARNNVFIDCAAVINGAEKEWEKFSHSIIAGENAPVDLPESVHRVNVAVTVGEDGAVTFAQGDAFAEAGSALHSEGEGAVASIGLQAGITHVGCGAPANISVPPVRFGNEPYIANSIREEYLYLQWRRLRPSGQALVIRDGVPMDEHAVAGPQGQTKLVFDISRFHGEM